MGYFVNELKQLKVEPEEARIVNFIFEEYALHGSVVRPEGKRVRT
jgi:hypothetical protein